MACTRQSALEYIRGARPHLVGALKNLSVILENLNQRDVFTHEEVSKIQAERDDYDKTRKILDWVTKKGEDACYQLLMIIDMTRKRTIERPNKDSAGPSQNRTFDLHHWISCFSFKEDAQMDINYVQGPRPCHRYQAKLKTKVQKMSRDFWLANKNLLKGTKKSDLSYFPLVLDTQESISSSKIKRFKCKKSKMIRPKKLRTYIPEDRAGISPTDLLKTDKNFLLVGKSGIGKTALVHEMLKLWAERDNKELDYMFYFDMRKIKEAVSLEELLYTEFSEPDEGKDEVLQDIKKNSDSVTVIFDGLTDLSSSVVQKLLKKDLLPAAKVIVVCRPEYEDDLSLEDFLRVEVKGFSEQTVKTYLSAILGEEHEKVSKNLELLTLCHVPTYALMAAVCFSSDTSEDCPQLCSITEIYINIVRFCLKKNNNRTSDRNLNNFIKEKNKQILSLAEAAFHATEGKTVNLTELVCEDSCVLSFLKPLVIKVAPTEKITTYAFLHYTMQEFFSALWVLTNPDKMNDILQQCLTEERKHMKHLIPFMCRLLAERSPSFLKWLIPAQDLKNRSNWFLKEMITTFSAYLTERDGEADDDISGLNVDTLFLCQCLYESQCPEACISFLDKLNYHLDLSGVILDPYPCCAVDYVVAQSKERKIRLNLEDVMVSEQATWRLIGCLQNVQMRDPLPLQLWKTFLLSEGQMDHISLLNLDGNQLHLPVRGERRLFERAVKVIQKTVTQVKVCLHWQSETAVCQNLCESLLEGLLSISSLSFRWTCRHPGPQNQEQSCWTQERKEKELLMDLCLKAARHKEESCDSVVKKLLSLFSVTSDFHSILLDLYQHDKSSRCSGVGPKLRTLFRSSAAAWTIDLSERKTSILLEVLKLQPDKKQVKLRGFSDEESEVRSFLQCLPYISELSFVPQSSDHYGETKFFGNLFCAAVERERETGEKILELLGSVCKYETGLLQWKWCDFFLDLYSSDPLKGLSVLPSLQSVFQLSPAVWTIDLSERKTSILLEVLKLQPEKKQVELRGFSDEESEVRSFLQCLPYISQLSFVPQSSDHYGETKFFGNLFCAAVERERETGEKILKLLGSVCTYETGLLQWKWCDFFLDLYSSDPLKGRSVLPSLQSVFQSSPTVWTIDLSKRKTSILLEVLKLQPEKKQVELCGFSDEESEVRSFLQCLPYISQLSYWFENQVKPLGNLMCAAAQSGHQTVELFKSVWTFNDSWDPEDQCDLLLDLFSHLKDYETKTGLRVLPSLQSVFQSSPTVWTINLSERKTSILLEVLKLQPEKKQVKLWGFSDEESEVRSFLQCLPYISQLSCDPEFFQSVCSSMCVRSREEVEQLASLLQLLGFTLTLTGELRRKTCRSVGRVLRLCGSKVDLVLTPRKMSVRGASLLFGHTTLLHSLRLSNDMALLLFQWVRRAAFPLTMEELSLAPQRGVPPERVLLRVVSSLASLLRYWGVRQLDLTEFWVPAHGLIPLLLHKGPLTLKLSEKMSQQLLSLFHEIQDKDLTRSFLDKVGGDLSSFSLSWEHLHCLLQPSTSQTITVNLRKSHFSQESITRLLPFLDRIVFKRPSPSFILTAIRGIYRAGDSPIIPTLLRSLDHVVNLSCREMDSVDCAALLFILRHSDRVKLNLLWTSIPTGEVESILSALDKVSQLSVDRNLLLRFIHCCDASDAQQGAAVTLLRTVQHRLDLSCSYCVELRDQGQSDHLSLTADDCRAISNILRCSNQETQLNLQDCEVEDSKLNLLFPVLDRVRLSASKAVLLQMVSLVPGNSESETVRRTASMWKALGGELDLSHNRLDQRACRALALMLEFSEGLSELDLSHCALTDQLLFTFITYLHKVQVLDLSHNKITDAAADELLLLVHTNPSIKTVRLFQNKIVSKELFRRDQRFEIW